MIFFMPAKIYLEENCVAAHAAELAALGQKALVVTGRHSAFRNGAMDDVAEALASHGKALAVFCEVEENPSIETVLKARDMGLAEGCDFVIGIGGGSPMDAAKAAALMMRHPDQGLPFLYDAGAVTDPLPVACVPTTCGTGSEATAVSVLTRHDTHTKGSIPHKIFPQLSLVDGKYLLAAPRKVIADTVMDALCHLYESLNAKATDCSRMCLDAGLKAWARSREAVLSGRRPTMGQCQDMMLASTLAGMAIAHTGTSLPHAMSYALTYDMGMAHGKACGYFLPGYLREYSQSDPAAVRYLLETAGFACPEDLEAYYGATCGRDQVPAGLLEKAVSLGKAPARLATAPWTADEAGLRRMAGLA